MLFNRDIECGDCLIKPACGDFFCDKTYMSLTIKMAKVKSKFHNTGRSFVYEHLLEENTCFVCGEEHCMGHNARTRITVCCINCKTSYIFNMDVKIHPVIYVFLKEDDGLTSAMRQGIRKPQESYMTTFNDFRCIIRAKGVTPQDEMSRVYWRSEKCL